MLNLIVTTPPKGKFIALFADGSGCDIFHKHEDGSIYTPVFVEYGECVDIDWLLDAGYLHWIALPDDYKIWGEK